MLSLIYFTNGGRALPRTTHCAWFLESGLRQVPGCQERKSRTRDMYRNLGSHKRLCNTLYGFIYDILEKAKLERPKPNSGCQTLGEGWRGIWQGEHVAVLVLVTGLLSLSKLAEMHTKKGEFYCMCCNLIL